MYCLFLLLIPLDVSLWLADMGAAFKATNRAAHLQLLEQTRKDAASINGAGCTVIYSAVVTTYNEGSDAIEGAMDSILESAHGFDSIEIIVVNDGHPDKQLFVDFAHKYARSSKTLEVDLSLAAGVGMSKLKSDGSLDELHYRPTCPKPRIVFARKPHGGLASARNFGISLASGMCTHTRKHKHKCTHTHTHTSIPHARARARARGTWQGFIPSM